MPRKSVKFSYRSQLITDKRASIVFYGLAALFCANSLKLTNRAKTSSPNDLALSSLNH